MYWCGFPKKIIRKKLDQYFIITNITFLNRMNQNQTSDLNANTII